MQSPFGSTVPTLRQGLEPDLSVCLLVTPVECRRPGAASFISCVPHGTSTINKLSYWVTRRLVKHGKWFFIVGGYESLEIWTSEAGEEEEGEAEEISSEKFWKSVVY